MSSLIAHRLSDERLGRRLASGEAPAFDELYRRYVHRLAAYGTHLLGDGAAGDDIAQVALMRAYQALRAGKVPERVRPWLYRIAHNAAIDVVRNRQELPTGEVPDRAGEIRDGAAGALVEAVAALPDRQRRVFVLRELHGLRIGETAAELGLTSQQVEQSLFAARNRLAELIVFGERLGCATVRRLADGPLDLRERRALKTHVRSCPACRRELGARGVALSVLPLPSFGWPQFGWLRGAVAGGSTPVAAKVAAVVAAATVVAGVPIAATTHKPHARVHPRPLTGAPGPDVPLALAATRRGPAAPRPHRRVQRAAIRIAAPTQPAQVFAVPATPVAAPTTQPVGAGSTAPAQPQPAPTAAAQPTSAGPQAAPVPAPGDGGGTTTTTEDTPPTTTTDSGGDTSGGGDVSSSDGGSGETVTTTDLSGGDAVPDSSGTSDGGSSGTDSSGG